MDELSPAVSQAVTAPLSRAAIFLVMTVKNGADSRAAFRGLCADLSGLVRTVGFRDTDQLDFRVGHQHPRQAGRHVGVRRLDRRV